MHAFKQPRNLDVLKIFNEVINALKFIDITPIVYGSLGLYLEIGEKGVANDVDLILPDSDFKKWPKIISTISSLGYSVDPNHSQEFVRGKYYISFIKQSEIEALIGQALDAKLKSDYYGISRESHYRIYVAGLKNIYRRRRKLADDNDKIALLVS